MSDVVIIIPIIILPEDATLDYLGIMEQLFCGGTAVGEGVLDGDGGRISEGGLGAEPGRNVGAERTEFVAEGFDV